MGIPDFDQIPYTKYPKGESISQRDTITVKVLKGLLRMLNDVFAFLVVAGMFVIGLLSFLMFFMPLTEPALYNSVYFR